MALVGADLVVLGQNSNSSTTMQNDNTMTSGNTNMGGRRRRRSYRRRGRRQATPMNANAACGPMTESTNMAGGMQENANTAEATENRNRGIGRRRRRGRRSSMAVAPENRNMAAEAPPATPQTSDAGEQADLSGTYNGNLTMTGGHEMSGPGTITISGNQVTIEGQGMTHTGRVSAVTTRGYTGATFYFPDVQDATTNTPLGVSVRARHSGNSLTLTPLAGARNGISFTSGGGGTGGGRRRYGRRRRRASGNTTGSTGETMTGDTSGNMNTAAPSDTSDDANANMSGGNMGGRRRRGRRRGGNMNVNTNGNMNMSGNMNTTP